MGLGRAASIGTGVSGFQLGDLESCRTAIYRLTRIIKFLMALVGWGGGKGRGGGADHTYLYNNKELNVNAALQT